MGVGARYLRGSRVVIYPLREKRDAEYGLFCKVIISLTVCIAVRIMYNGCLRLKHLCQ